MHGRFCEFAVADGELARAELDALFKQEMMTADLPQHVVEGLSEQANFIIRGHRKRRGRQTIVVPEKQRGVRSLKWLNDPVCEESDSHGHQAEHDKNAADQEER